MGTGSRILLVYVRSVAAVTALLGVTGMFRLWDVGPAGMSIYLFTAVVFAYIGFARVDESFICYIVCGMGLLYLISATLLIGMYMFGIADRPDHVLKQGLIRVAFCVANLLAAYAFRGSPPVPGPEESDADAASVEEL